MRLGISLSTCNRLPLATKISYHRARGQRCAREGPPRSSARPRDHPSPSISGTICRDAKELQQFCQLELLLSSPAPASRAYSAISSSYRLRYLDPTGSLPPYPTRSSASSPAAVSSCFLLFF